MLILDSTLTDYDTLTYTKALPDCSNDLITVFRQKKFPKWELNAKIGQEASGIT